MLRPARTVIKTFKRAPGLKIREVDHELFVADPDQGTIHHLNETASAAWRALAKPRTGNELVALFQAAFPSMSKRKIANDVQEILNFLEERRLLQVKTNHRSRLK